MSDLGLPGTVLARPIGSGARGAYRRTPIVGEPPAVRGTVHVDLERCKGCELCIEYCPTHVLNLSSEFNSKGYHYPLVVSDDCIACHACTLICPDFAIFSTGASAWKEGRWATERS